MHICVGFLAFKGVVAFGGFCLKREVLGIEWLHERQREKAESPKVPHLAGEMGAQGTQTQGLVTQGLLTWKAP